MVDVEYMLRCVCVCVCVCVGGGWHDEGSVENALSVFKKE